jgi:hypothetical protein
MWPEVIFLNCELPGSIRGWEAARQLGADSELRRIPVIVCSWLNEQAARTLVGVAVAYLQKPELHYDDFLEALCRAECAGGTATPPKWARRSCPCFKEDLWPSADASADEGERA